MADVINPVLVQANFDESGKLEDSGIVAFGGGVLRVGRLDTFSAKWEQRLSDEGLTYTSMKDAMHFDGPYFGWKNFAEKRDAVLRDLARLILDSSMLMVTSPMTSAQFKA